MALGNIVVNESGAAGGTLVRIEDEAIPYLKWLAETFPKEFSKALGSVGFMLRQSIKTGLAAGSPGGATLPELSDISRYRLLDDYRGRKRSAKTGRYRAPRNLKIRERFYGRMLNAAAYKNETAKLQVSTGWLTASASYWARRLQPGFRVPITEKMRRFFWAAGIPLAKSKTEFTAPARQVITPVFEADKGKILPLVEQKIAAHLEKGVSRFRKAA